MTTLKPLLSTQNSFFSPKAKIGKDLFVTSANCWDSQTDTPIS
uniref:Uncharacterized protein n=1 Tax=Anguilla anguilla TaxID=7936 RepID=A0A0E9XL38_ANGAN